MDGNNKNTPLVYKGSEEICAAVGIPKRQINNYVKNHGLPAFKVGGKEWLAIPADLKTWIKEQSEKHLK